MTAPTTSARRGRPPLPGGPATSAQRSAKSRAARGVVTVELDSDTMNLINQVICDLDLPNRQAAIVWALQIAHNTDTSNSRL